MSFLGKEDILNSALAEPSSAERFKDFPIKARSPCVQQEGRYTVPELLLSTGQGS